VRVDARIERQMGDCGIGDQSRKFRSIHVRADGSNIPELAGDLASQRGKPSSDRRIAARNDLDDYRQAIFGIAARVLESTIKLGISCWGTVRPRSTASRPPPPSPRQTIYVARGDS
jgi:hypothetical protein